MDRASLDDVLRADLGPRPVRRVTGERALAFLHDMLTQDLRHPAPGGRLLAALLTDKGRIRAILRVLVLGDAEALLDFDAAAEPGVEQGLVRVAPLAGVEVTAAGDRLGDVPMSDAARIRAGFPLYGVDVDDGTLVNETPVLESAVSFAKGCYPGQESVARVRNLGDLRRRLAVLAVDGPPPDAGDVVRTIAGEDAGHVTSAAADAGGTVAFAMLRAEAVVAGRLTAGGSPATVALV